MNDLIGKFAVMNGELYVSRGILRNVYSEKFYCVYKICFYCDETDTHYKVRLIPIKEFLFDASATSGYFKKDLYTDTLKNLIDIGMCSIFDDEESAKNDALFKNRKVYDEGNYEKYY